MIKIKNIYYMLAYAYQTLKKSEFKSIQTEEFESLHDLMAVILINGVSNQIKRGIHKDYITHTEQTGSLRGKIDVTNSVKQNTLINRQMVCHFDEFSENTILNQVIKTTLQLLIRHGEVKPENRKELRKISLFLGNVDTLNPKSINWRSIQYQRNNITYKMLINICELIIEGMLMTAETGDYKMEQFLDDQQMHRLYEKFLLGYFKKEYPHFSPAASYIDWNVDNGITEFLPAMKSDIILTHGPKKLIIDAKYYAKTMQTNAMFNNKTIHSSNLYQMYTYVKNKDRTNSGNVSGLVLYAKTDEEITPDHDYYFGGNRISIKTLDLDSEWTRIVRQLNKIAEMV